MANILFTGGSGLLGAEMRKIYSDELFPTSIDLDITDVEECFRYMNRLMVRYPSITTIVHMAAFTSPPKIDVDPLRAVAVNIVGTSNIVSVAILYGLRLIYMSTDYVFDGKKGNYTESDAVNPINKYSWSKLGGECAVRLCDKHVIVRTSFGPDEFPYPGAPTDQYTSREKVSTIAKKIAKVVNSDFIGTINIGSERRTVYDYAKSVSPEKEIKEMSIRDMKSATPEDTSLNTGLYKKLFGDN
jgi:dTDP-4-dehydrorhamnose reductase